MTLPTEGFVLFDIAHPVDPQVNGFGFYRSVDAGTTLLLDQRVEIPTENQYSITHDFELFVVGALTNVSNLQLHHSFDLGDYVFTSGTEMARGTQIWEPGHVAAPEAAGAFAPPDRDTFFQNSEDATNGYHATHRWEIALLGHTQSLRWAFLTDLADASLGSQVETDNDLPPSANIAAVFDEHVFLAGNEDNPHRLFWSKRFRPEAFPVDNFIDIGTAADPIMELAPMVGTLGVLSRQTKYYVNGDFTSGFVANESPDRRGTPARTHAVTPAGIAFIARDGIFITTFVGKDAEISAAIFPLFIGETVNEYEPINWDAITTASLAYYKGKLYFAYPSGSNTQPDLVMVYSFTTNEWSTYQMVVRSMFVEEDTDLLTAGATDGLVYNLESGSTDNGTDIALTVDTKDFTDGQPSLRKLYLYAKVDADAQSETITANFFIDGTSQHTASVTGSRTKALIPMPEDAWGHQMRVRLTYTGNKAIRIYGVELHYLPLQPY